MCTGAEFLLPALLAAGGTAVSTIAQQRALKQQDEEAARGIMRQAEMQRQASQKVGENIDQFKASTPEGERVAALNDFTAALKRAQSQPGSDPLSAPAGASERFAEDVGTAKSANAAETRGLAERTARIDAPSFQRLREGQASADLASNLGLIQGNSQAEDFLTRLRVASRQPNPFATGIGEGIASFGSAMAGRALPIKKLPGKIKPGMVMDTPSIPSGVMVG